MKTVAVFHPSSELYGADRILVNALKALPSNVSKRVYLKFEGPLANFIEEEVENVEVIQVAFMPVIYRKMFTPLGLITFIFNWLRFLFFVRKENSKYGFKSAYLNTLSVSMIAPMLKFLSVPSYTHVHEIIESPRLVGKITALITMRFSTRVICVSKTVREHLLSYSSRRFAKVEVIHNGINPIEVNEVKNDQISFYLFGRIMPKKGQWFLMDALSLIPKDVLQKSRFVIIGGVLDGNEYLLDELQQKIKQYRLDEVVTIKGFTSDIAGELSRADICLVPSMMKDPFPTTVLEAMSAGKPVLATNHGGAKEAVLDGETGRLIDKGDTKSFAKIIEEWISDRKKITEMGKKASRRFREHFSIETFNEKWMEFQLTNKFI